MLNLLKGIGVIIDDALVENEKKDIIWNIKESFESKNIPLLIYNELPTNELTKSFHTISFLLLDWDLYGSQMELGVSKPQTATDDNIEFIRQFNSICFAPIFIFSNENIDDIKNKLIEEGLYDNNKNNHIFVESKNELNHADSLFSKLETWVKTTSSIYVLKEWEKSLNIAKCNLFWDFYNTNSNWPGILQQTFTNDGVDENHELGALIYKNLIARTISFEFDEKILGINTDEVSKEDLRKVLECERFLKQDKLSNNPATGDIFKIHNTQNNEIQYFINIRPDCDFIRNAQKGENVEIYCLKGRIIDEDTINAESADKSTFFNNGCFEEKINHIFIAFIDNGKIIEFLFRDIKLKKWNDVKSQRIGRLLPPYITRLQQKYAFYLQRQGLPAIPDKAIISHSIPPASSNSSYTSPRKFLHPL